MIEDPQIKFKAPINLDEHDLNKAMQRPAAGEASYCMKEWTRITDAKEVYKLVMDSLRKPVTPEAIRGVLIIGLMLGFDLHAAFGDSGEAALYMEAEEKKNGR